MNKKIKFLSALSTIVLTVTVVLNGWPCMFVYHQPKIPEGIKNLRKS